MARLSPKLISSIWGEGGFMLYFSDPLNQQQYQCAQTIKPTQGSGEIISYMLVFEKYGKRLKSLKIQTKIII